MLTRVDDGSIDRRKNPSMITQRQLGTGNMEFFQQPPHPGPLPQAVAGAARCIFGDWWVNPGFWGGKQETQQPPHPSPLPQAVAGAVAAQ